jgi:hypothetical protein
MTANRSGLLGVALLFGTVTAVMFLFRGGDGADNAANVNEAQRALARKQQLEQAYAQSRARLELGAYVLSSKRVSETEEIATLVIPEGLAEELDTRCVVYKNSELRTSSITCSGICSGRPRRHPEVPAFQELPHPVGLDGVA